MKNWQVVGDLPRQSGHSVCFDDDCETRGTTDYTGHLASEACGTLLGEDEEAAAYL